MNETQFEAGWTIGFQQDGRELLLVAVKVTFVIPDDGEEALLAESQVPLIEADEFTGEPGLSAPLYESDYAHHKPCCDVLLNGSAYPQDGRPAERLAATIRVGSMTKAINVLGDRVWHAGLGTCLPSRPIPFMKMPITYDRAFGGVGTDKNDPENKIDTYLENPVGVGYYPLSKPESLDGKPLPNIEEIGKSVEDPRGKYKPMSFGPVGRNWQPRVSFAGTYDQNWLNNRAPFWPDDFDYRYFNAAPVDQQIPFPMGGEQVVLKNLSQKNIAPFRLPRLSMPILFIPYRDVDRRIEAMIDTIILQPDEGRFMMTWRASLPLRRNCFEIRETIVGKAVEEQTWKGNP